MRIKGQREREREYQSQRKGKGRENKCEKTKVQKNRIVIPQRKIITGKVKQTRGQLCKVERNVNICHYISARIRTAMTRLEIRNETPQLAWNTNKNQKQNLAISFNIPLVILSHFSSFCNSSDPLFPTHSEFPCATLVLSPAKRILPTPLHRPCPFYTSRPSCMCITLPKATHLTIWQITSSLVQGEAGAYVCLCGRGQGDASTLKVFYSCSVLVWSLGNIRVSSRTCAAGTVRGSVLDFVSFISVEACVSICVYVCV